MKLLVDPAQEECCCLDKLYRTDVRALSSSKEPALESKNSSKQTRDPPANLPSRRHLKR